MFINDLPYATNFKFNLPVGFEAREFDNEFVIWVPEYELSFCMNKLDNKKAFDAGINNINNMMLPLRKIFTKEDFKTKLTELDIDYQQLAIILGVTKRTVYRWATEIEVPRYVKVILDTIEYMNKNKINYRQVFGLEQKS